MEDQNSWARHYFIESFHNQTPEFDSYLDLDDETDKEVNTVSMDSVLPNDLLERIFTYLPIASILRAGSVCKRWRDITTSKRFLWNGSNPSLRKPWYFMFTSLDEPVGYAYDPILKKWHNIDLPHIKSSSWTIASSQGLVCFMDDQSRSELYVCNPITRSCKALNEAPGPKFADNCALAVLVDNESHNYSISVVKSNQVPGDFARYDLSIHLFDSETMAWVTTLTETLTGWRGGNESIICDGVLYVLLFTTHGGPQDTRHGFIAYNLRGGSRLAHGLLTSSFIAVPCYLTCVRLMNLREKLVMVGGIGKQDRPDIIKGIRIWVLKGREWEEIARMPQKFFQGFGELDDVFGSSGGNDLVYIQSYGAPALLVFDMNQKQWRWSQKCPVTKRFPLELFSGFCFEPRLEISP